MWLEFSSKALVLHSHLEVRRTHELLLSGVATASTRTCSGVCTSAVMDEGRRSTSRSPAEAQKRPHMPLRTSVAA
jgi:hypothetical protein